MSEELKPCPFCGGKVDPLGWLSRTGEVIVRGPECEECGATATNVEVWNTRAELAALKAGEPVEKILELILDECRYWQHRDEARRGGFANLYSAAKEVASNTAPPVSANARLVPVKLLERCLLILEPMKAWRQTYQELRALLAQSESKEVKS